MGCLAMSRNNNEHYDAVYAAEKYIGFYKKFPQEVESVFKRQAEQGKLTKDQLLKIQQQLKTPTLPSSELEQSKVNNWKSDEGLTRFYSNFVDENDNTKLNANKVALAAVLISGGNVKERASIIFDILANDGSGKIGISHLNYYINQLKNLTYDYLLEYATGFPYPKNPGKVITKQQIQDLKSQWLENSFEKAIRKQLIPQDTQELIDKPTFITNLTRTKYQDFTSAQGVRSFHLRDEKVIKAKPSEQQQKDKGIQSNSQNANQQSSQQTK